MDEGTIVKRRELLAKFCCCGACSCACLHESRTFAFPELIAPNRENEKELLAAFEHRNAKVDSLFAKAMENGMTSHESAVFDHKKKVFEEGFADYQSKSKAIEALELGVGTFPNARFFPKSVPIDLYGLDPNVAMGDYALEHSQSELGDNVRYRNLRGVTEQIPFADNSLDVVTFSLVLCSVESHERSLSEVKCVLKPGGKFIFIEHVLSQTSESLKQQQETLTPLQVQAADGCHLNRRTNRRTD